MKKRIVSCACAAFLVAGCNQTSVEQASREFNQLPDVVRQVVRSTAPDAEIAGVEKQTFQNRTIYRVKFRDPQRHPAMDVAADGMIVKYQAGTAALGRSGPPVEVQHGGGAKDDSLSALPMGVRMAIEEHAPKAQVADIHRIEQNGRVVYEVEYAGKEPRPVLHVAMDGTVLKKPGEVAKPEPPKNPQQK